MPILTLERLKQQMEYSPDTGLFHWKVVRRGRRKDGSTLYVGNLAGSRNGRGYIQLVIDGHSYLAHRCAWFYVHGEWPRTGLTHRNKVLSDNRMDNLVPVSGSQQQWYRRVSRNNKSGVSGVGRFRTKWRAQIVVQGKSIFLGLYKKRSEAITARLLGEAKYHRRAAA